MNKIKDILYDTNDILIALLILCIAAFVIYTRVDSIMNYPEMAMANSNTGGQILTTLPDEEGDQPASVSAGAVVSSGEAISEEGNASGGAISEEGNAADDYPYSVFIGYGQSMDKVAQNLVDMGFFKTKDDFFTALEERNAETKVQAGNFVIPRNATVDELIEIITKPGL